MRKGCLAQNFPEPEENGTATFAKTRVNRDGATAAILRYFRATSRCQGTKLNRYLSIDHVFT